MEKEKRSDTIVEHKSTTCGKEEIQPFFKEYLEKLALIFCLTDSSDPLDVNIVFCKKMVMFFCILSIYGDI